MVNPLPKTISVIPVQFENASFSIFVTLSGIISLPDNDVHPENIFAFIVVTLAGQDEIFSIPLLSKALLSIVVTVSGIVNAPVIFLQPANALSPIVSKPSGSVNSPFILVQL